MEPLSWRSLPISLDNLHRFPMPDSLGELGRHGKFEGSTKQGQANRLGYSVPQTEPQRQALHGLGYRHAASRRTRGPRTAPNPLSWRPGATDGSTPHLPEHSILGANRPTRPWAS